MNTPLADLRIKPLPPLLPTEGGGRIKKLALQFTDGMGIGDRAKSLRDFVSSTRIDREFICRLSKGVSTGRDASGRYSPDVTPQTPRDAWVFNAMRYKSGRLAPELVTFIENSARGIKAYTPTLEEFNAFAEIEPSLPVSSYSQPFPAFVVEIPAAFSERLGFVYPSRLMGTPVVPYRPLFVILHAPAGVGAINAVVMSDSPACYSFGATIGEFATGVGIAEDMDAIIATEMALISAGGTTNPENFGEFTAREEMLTRFVASMCGMFREVVTASVNACLSLMQFGFRERLTPERQGAMVRLAKSRKKKLADKIALNQSTLDGLPQFFTFEQKINIRVSVGSTDAATDSDRKAGTVRPHWRRAHWRTQRHGVGLALSKRILIPHTMVKRDRFAGTDADTTTTYRNPT